MVHPKAMVRPEIKGELRQKLQVVKNGFISRCYNKTNPKYKNYGARGVIVTPSWHKIGGFLEDFDSIPGWDETQFMQGNLQLDKDLRVKGNKIYSKDTCIWVSPSTNVKFKPNVHTRKIIGVDIWGVKREFYNATEFSRENEGLNRTTIQRVANGEANFCGKWYFYFEGDTPKPPLIYQAKRDEEILREFYQSKLEKCIGMKPTTISREKSKGKNNITYKDWEVSWFVLDVN